MCPLFRGKIILYVINNTGSEISSEASVHSAIIPLNGNDVIQSPLNWKKAAHTSIPKKDPVKFGFDYPEKVWLTPSAFALTVIHGKEIRDGALSGTIFTDNTDRPDKWWNANRRTIGGIEIEQYNNVKKELDSVLACIKRLPADQKSSDKCFQF